MRSLRLVTLLGIYLLFFGTAAMADVFNLSASGGGVALTATIDGTQSVTPGAFYVTDFSGLVNGQSATLLPTSGPGVITTSNFVGGFAVVFNNVLNLSTPYFDQYGIGLTFANGDIGNLFFNGVNYRYIEFSSSNSPIRQSVNVSVTPTPEPATWSLMLIGVGLLGLVMVMRKRIHLGNQQTT